MILIVSSSLIYTPNFVKAVDKFEDTDEMERFFDHYFAKQMESKHIPGVGFIIIKDGKPILSKGYGYADLNKEIMVHPDEIVFRTASVSKIFVLMSILQLYEEGFIDLDEEVATYLTPNDPLNEKVKGIKIKHLLSHTEGFPSRDLASFVKKAEDIPPIHDTLITDLKEQSVEPGTVIAYGGIGSVLAAHIIENITGVSFDKYIEKNIQTPLLMNQSTFLQELPHDIAEKLAKTYVYEDGEYQETKFLYGATPPSGGLSSTPTEMSRLLVALMQGGKFQEKKILEPQTVELMLQPQFRGHQNLPGVTYGFFEHFENNKWALIRDGSGFGVTTRLFYIPEENIGYVYFQNIRGDELLDDLTTTFFDYFFEEETEHSELIPLTDKEVKSLQGTYRAVQYHRNIMKIGSFMSGMIVHITPNNDGTLQLTVSGPGDTAGWGGFGKETTLTQIEPMLFKRSDTEGYVSFEKIGNDVYMHSGNGYHSSYEMIPWYEKTVPQIVFLCMFILIFTITLIWAVVRLIRRRNIEESIHSKRFLKLAGITSFLNLAFPYPLFLFGFITRVEGFPAVAFGIPLTVKILLYVPVITGILALIMCVFVFKIYQHDNVSLAKKIAYSVMTLAALLFIPFLIYWRIFPGFAS